MIAALIAILPAAVGGYSVFIVPSLVVANLALASTGLCVAGALVRRYALVVAGAWVSVLTYIGALLSSGKGVEVWPALGVGGAVFVLLEVGYDWVTAVRAVVGAGTYRMRVLALTRTVAVAAAGVLVIGTLALNATVHLGIQVPPHVVALAALAAVCSMAVPVLYLVRRSADEEGEGG